MLLLLAVRATHAAALWRDECDSVATATLPSFSELLRYFQFDSFPLPFALALRGYITIAGNSDASLRVLGALVGIGLLLVGWWNARRCGAPPLAFLTLAALSPTFLIWGTTIRGYGIGSVMIVFAFAATANFLTRPTNRNALLMAAAFIAAVQCLVSNTVLVFAICLAGMGVSILRGERKTALIIASALGLAALSFLPYVPTYFKMGWHVLLQANASLGAWSETFRDSLGARNPASLIAWLMFAAIATISCIARLLKLTTSTLSFFAVLVALFSLAGGGIFFGLLKYLPNVWYFLPFVCLLAAAVELPNASIKASNTIRVVRLVVCIVAVTATWWPNWQVLTRRQSNVDLIADWLASHTEARDLVIVNPWFFGVSFNRYYRGVAPWITLPVLTERRIHRYDLLREKMAEEDPLNDLRPTIEKTLRNGGRIYLVGCAHWLGKDERPTVLPPAPRSEYRWNFLPYIVAWSEQIAEFLLAHIQSGATLPQLGDHINPDEDVQLCQVEGWHD